MRWKFELALEYVLAGASGRVVRFQVVEDLAAYADAGHQRQAVVNRPDVLHEEVRVHVPVLHQVRNSHEVHLVHVERAALTRIVAVADAA